MPTFTADEQLSVANFETDEEIYVPGWYTDEEISTGYEARSGYTEVRLYDSSGSRKHFPNHAIESIDWELIERGYFGNATITIKDDFDTGSIDLTGSDYIEVWIEGALRYRGYVGTPEQTLAVPEKKSIRCYGLAERLNKCLVNKRYVWPGGVDIAQAFAKITDDYVSPKITDLVKDIQDVGYTVENLELQRVTAREALDNLCSQAAGRAVWGFDVDDDGYNRIFLRPKGTDTLYKHSPGGRVSHYSYPPDYTRIVNRVHLIGGEAKFPNLVLNPSFEQPKQADANDGNLITNGGFEDWLTDWTLGGGASQKNVWPRSGNSCVELDNANEYVQQTGRVIEAEEDYTVEVWYLSPNASSFSITITPDVGSPIVSPVYACDERDFSTYRSKRFQFTAPVGASSCTIKVNAESSVDDFRIDDLSMWKTSGIVQEGWQSLKDAQSTGEVDWAYDVDQYHGGYSVHYNADVGASDYCWLLQSSAAAISLKPSRQYQLSVRVKSLSGSPDVKLVLWVNKSDGSGRRVESDPLTLAAPGSGWQLLYFDGADGWTSAADDSTVRVGLKFIQDAEVLVDAFYFTDWNEDDTVLDNFVAGKNFEFTLDTDQDFVQNDADLPAAVKTSITDYGIRDISESVEGISDLATAQNWGIGYFGLNAQPVTSHRVGIADWWEEIAPDGLFRLLGTSIEDAFPVRIAYKLGGDSMLNLDIDLNTERPTFEGLLKRVVDDAKRAAKAGIASSASSAPSGGSGGSSSGGHARSHTLLSTDDHSDIATYINQALLTSSNVQFNNITAGGYVSASGYLAGGGLTINANQLYLSDHSGIEFFNTGKVVVNLATNSGSPASIFTIKGRSGQTENLQDWRTNADALVASVGIDGSGTFAGLTVGSLAGLIKGTAGVLAAIAAGTSSQYLRGDLTMQTLNQAAVAGLTTADSPTFAGITITGLSGMLKATAGALGAAVAGTDYPGLAFANIFTAAQKINVNSATAFVVEQDGVKDDVLVVDTANGLIGVNSTPDSNYLLTLLPNQSAATSKGIKFYPTYTSTSGILTAYALDAWLTIASGSSSANILAYAINGGITNNRGTTSNISMWQRIGGLNYFAIEQGAYSGGLVVHTTTLDCKGAILTATMSAVISRASGAGAVNLNPRGVELTCTANINNNRTGGTTNYNPYGAYLSTIVDDTSYQQGTVAGAVHGAYNSVAVTLGKSANALSWRPLVYGYRSYINLTDDDGNTNYTKYGFYADFAGVGTNYSFYAASGDWAAAADSMKFWFGAGLDASIYYDGTDLIINTDDVGTGSCKINSLEIDKDGFLKPISSADASAPNNSIYYSTDAAKLVYKDSGGTPNALY